MVKGISSNGCGDVDGLVNWSSVVNVVGADLTAAVSEGPRRLVVSVEAMISAGGMRGEKNDLRERDEKNEKVYNDKISLPF